MGRHVGAVVVAGGLVVGVVRSHNLAEGGRSLTITPVTAIEQLPAQDAVDLWGALGVTPALRGCRFSRVLTEPAPWCRHGSSSFGAEGIQLDFTGRDKELEDLHDSLTGEDPAPVVLYGLGGVGKTQLAIEYLDAHGRELNVVWMIRGDRPDVLAADFAALGVALGLPRPDEPDIEAELATVLTWLNSNPGWLLLFDNIDTKESMKEVNRLLPEARHGRLVITSQISSCRPGTAG